MPFAVARVTCEDRFYILPLPVAAREEHLAALKGRHVVGVRHQTHHKVRLVLVGGMEDCHAPSGVHFAL